MSFDETPAGKARFDASSLAVLAAALVGAALVVWSTARWGVGIDNDAVEFVAAAESLIDGRGFVQSNGAPFALWPPLMPTLLAAGLVLGAPIETTLLVLHPLALLALVWISAGLARRASGSGCVAVACALSLAVAPVLFESMVMGLSEALFVTFAVAAVAGLERHLTTRSRASFAVCALFAALSVLQRYLGVTLVMALSCVLLVAPSTESLAHRVRRTLVFGVLASAPILAWCLRTRALTGHLTGNRGTVAGLGMGELAELTWETFVGWMWPGGGELPLVQLLAAVLILGIVAALLWPSKRRAAPSRKLCAVLAAFPLVYFALSTYLNHRWELDSIGDRQLVPLAPFAALFAALGFAAARARLERPGARRAFEVLCGLALLAHLGAATMHLSTRMAFWRHEGPGVYGVRSFRESPFTALVREFDFEGQVESNDPHAVYYLARHHTRAAPRRPGGFRKLGAGASERQLAPTLVWFEQNERAVAPIAELSPSFEIEELAQAPGGAIYRVTPRRERL